MELDDDELEATRQFYGVGRKKKKLEVGPGGPMDEMPNDDLTKLIDRINGKEVCDYLDYMFLSAKADRDINFPHYL